MTTRSPTLVGVLLAAVVAIGLWTAVSVGQEKAAAPVKLEGTYVLVERVLPDGSKMTPPNVVGVMTYTKNHRNFHVYWRDPDGKRFSIAYVAKYKLTGKEYSEENVYLMVNDEIGGGGLEYTLTPEKGTAPVTREGKTIAIDLPLWNEPHVVFDGKTIVATREGEFVDHWKRVE